MGTVTIFRIGFYDGTRFNLVELNEYIPLIFSRKGVLFTHREFPFSRRTFDVRKSFIKMF